MFSRISVLFSVTTPNINNLLALPFKKRPVINSNKFKAVWTDKKEYVRKVTGHGGSYQVNKAKRMSESFPWPGSPVETGICYLIMNFAKLSLNRLS